MSCSIIVLYGSQQGNSMEIANIIYNEINQIITNKSDCAIQCVSMIDYITIDAELKKIHTYDIIVVVISTTGNGEAPDNATKFVRFLKRQRHNTTWLCNSYFSVLGLGDSNYDKFNAMGKLFDETFSNCGGKRIIAAGLADDGIGLELVVEPWKKDLVNALNNNVIQSIIHSKKTTTTTTQPDIQSIHYTSHHKQTSNDTSDSQQSQHSGSIIDELDQFHNTLIDNESKTTNTTEIPQTLPRLAKCKLRLKFHDPVDCSITDYFASRWHHIDTESVLQGYTAESPCYATLSNARYETTEQSHQQGRVVVHMELNLPHTTSAHRVMYNPGDSIGIYVSNDNNIVLQLCERLHVKPQQMIEFTHSKANQSDSVAQSISSYTVPSHYPSKCTIYQALALSCDISSVPKKSFLRMLAEYCTDNNDKQQLYQLCTRDGANQYISYILNNRPNLLDILLRYTSCNPPLSHLFHLLPPLQPRYYSVSSSPLVQPTSVHFAYSLVQWTSADQCIHNGIATSYLTNLAIQHKFIQPYHNMTPAVDTTLHNQQSTIPIFIKRSSDFMLPSDIKSPCIMIGPGTGVAPFRAFTEHRSVQRHACASGGTSMGWWRGLELEETDEKLPPHKTKSKYITDHIDDTQICEIVSNDIMQHHTHITEYAIDQQQSKYTAQTIEANDNNIQIDPDAVYENIEKVCAHDDNHMSSSSTKSHNTTTGDMLLFYGCRGRDIDFIYKNQWSKYVSDGTLTAMYTAFSREQQHKVYVQDKIKLHGAQVADLIVNHNAYVFVCGDGTAMAKDVNQALTECLVRDGNLSDVDANQYIDTMCKQHRYVTDIWC